MKFLSLPCIAILAALTAGCEREVERPSAPQRTSITKTVTSDTVVARDADLEAGGTKTGTTSTKKSSTTTIDGKVVDHAETGESSSKK